MHIYIIYVSVRYQNRVRIWFKFGFLVSENHLSILSQNELLAAVVFLLYRIRTVQLCPQQTVLTY